jgi:GR25 family glycosyltransferase involved in LPS biosynthesis
VFSRFAQDVVAQATGTPPRLIYHGVDTKSFFPMDKQKARQSANVDGHFVVGTVARNQLRKNLPALVKAFAKFAEGKPDVLLYLHTQVRGEWDMQVLTRRFGIDEKTRVTADLTTDSGVPDTMLAMVYNAMDVFVLPTMAEGFGLPIMESQACGVPALVTDFSACPELVPDAMQRLKVKDTLVMNRNLEQAIVDVDDIVAKLEHFYRNREQLRELGRRCHEFAQQFEWSAACKQFVELIGSLPTKQRAAIPDSSKGRAPEEPISLPAPRTIEAAVAIPTITVLGGAGLSPAPPSNERYLAFGCFDRVYVVNLDSDGERMNRVSARLKKLGIVFERFAALVPSADLKPKDPYNKAGAYACAQSHRAIYQLAWERGEKRILVFEDDVVLRDDASEWMQKIVPQLAPLPWDLFYPGLHLVKAGRRCGENLLEVKQGYHTHAYAVSRKAIPWLIAHADRIVAAQAGTFDGFEDPKLLKVCANPILAIQEPNYSHTRGEHMNRTDQYFALFDADDFRHNCQEMKSWPQGK